jgi:m7GpppX diphosphatase
MNQFIQSSNLYQKKQKLVSNIKKSTKNDRTFCTLDDDKYYEKEFDGIENNINTDKISDSTNTSLNFINFKKNSNSIKSCSINSEIDLITKLKNSDTIKLLNSDSKSTTFIDTKENKFYNLEINKVTSLNNVTQLKSIIKNDRYNILNVTVPIDGILTIISDYNSNDDDIELHKYNSKKKFITYIETPDIYNKITKSHAIRSEKKWIYNIIDNIEEQDRIVYHNDYFVILPDAAWTNGDINDLYLLLICKRKDIYSIRDLTGEHLQLLENMLKSLEHIERIYGIPQCMLRTYFHYKPSTWHLHLHINNINTTKQYSYNVERCHSLVSVINNIKINKDYYKKADIEVVKYI